MKPLTERWLRLRLTFCCQIGIHNMTAEAILQKKKSLVVEALLVDPVVTVSKGIPDLVDHMIAEQSPWLDYLK